MIIKDEKLGNYEIHHDGNNYSVLENTGAVDRGGKPMFKTHAYCSSVGQAVKKISKLLVEEKGKEFTLDQYINTIMNMTKKIEAILN